MKRILGATMLLAVLASPAMAHEEPGDVNNKPYVETDVISANGIQQEQLTPEQQAHETNQGSPIDLNQRDNAGKVITTPSSSQ